MGVFTQLIWGAAYAGRMRVETHNPRSLSGISTGRISLTSAAVCVGILLWAVANAYLA
jgi:hypothetical protein